MKLLALLGLMGSIFLAPSVSFSVPDYASPGYSITGSIAQVYPLCRADLQEHIKGNPRYLIGVLDANPQLTPAEKNYLVQSCLTFKLGALSYAELKPDSGIVTAE